MAIGRIKVNFEAGTSSFVDGMKFAEAQARQSANSIKTTLRKEMQESKASLALVGEEFGIHLPRHIRTFVAGLPGISKAMSAAFTGFAIIGVIEVLAKAGEKVYDLVKAFNNMSEAAKKNAAEWASLSQETQISNDRLDVSIAKLDVEIAKLEHKPVNYLAVALAEAKAAADELGKSLQADIDKQIKLLGKTPWYQVTDNSASTTAKKTRDQLNDVTMIGLGMGSSQDTGSAYAKQLDPKSQINARMNILRAAIAETQSHIANTATSAVRIGYGNTAGDKELAENKASLVQYVEELGNMQRKVEELKKQAQVGDLQAKKTNETRAPTQPMENGYAKALAAAQERVKNMQALVAIEQMDYSKRAEQLAINKANLEITKIDAEITAKNAEIDARNATAKANHSKAAPEQHIANLTDAQKEQLRAAEIRLSQEQLNQTMAQGANAYALRIKQENDLTAAIKQGADAVMMANALAQAENALQGQNAPLTDIAIKAEQLYVEAKAKAHATATQSITDKGYELEAQQRLNAAYLGGAEAVRQAELQNKIDAISRGTGSDSDKQQQIALATLASQQQHYAKIAEAAGQAVNADRDRLLFLQQELSVLKSMDSSAPEVQAAVKQTTKDLIELQSKMALATGSPMVGMKAYFNELSVSTKTAAQEMHDFLGKAFDDLNDQMAKALLGQKTNWHSFFESMATSTAKAGIKQAEGAIAKGLGAGNAGSPMSGIAKAFELGGKPDGSVSNPLNVKVIGGRGLPNLGGGSEPLMVPGGSMTSYTGGPAPEINTLGVGLPMMSFAMIPGFASGGDPSPYGLSLVGEDGPELHSNLGGHVTSNSDLRKMLGGQNIFHIDARGANAADVDMRVRKAIAESHVASVRGAVVAQRELNVRRPASRRN